MFLSQRPNNDPQPLRVDNSDGHVTKGKTRFAVNDPYKYRNAKFVFDPRPEFTQTRDPYPYVGPNGATRHAFPGWLGSDRLAWSPRHEEFDAPVNPILFAVRQGKANPTAMLKAIRTGNAISPAGKVFQKTASHKLGEFRVVPFEGDWCVKGGRGGSQRRADMEEFAFARIAHARLVLSKLVAVYGG